MAMDRNNPYETARAMAGLKLWKSASRHNWALVPQTTEDPYVAVAVAEKGDSPVEGRLMLFPGLPVFRDFVLSRHFGDYGVALTPMDFDHYEVAALKSGDVEIFHYRPGFLPVRPVSEELRILAPMLFECYGLMMRFEKEPDLPLKYVSQNALFARKEVVEGVWQDGPLKLPSDESMPASVERIALDSSKCEVAKGLPVYPRQVWEADFMLVPNYRTLEKDARFLYVFAIVDSIAQTRLAWFRLSVDGSPNGLLRLWEGHAQRILDTIVQSGRVPGEVHVRSQRMARFVRPLCRELPFRLVQHAKLPALDIVFRLAMTEQGK